MTLVICINYSEFLLIDEGAKAGSAKMENISVIYRTGVGVRVSHLNGLLQLFVTTPQEFYVSKCTHNKR